VSFIATHNGHYWDFETSTAEEVNLDDIAYALSHINRYTGHVGGYSVAAHSIHVARITAMLGRPDLELQALIHDAHEAYVGDVSSPLKRMLPDFCAVEKRTEAIVRAAFDLPAELDPVVKKADLMALHDEAVMFFGGDLTRWQFAEPTSGLFPNRRLNGSHWRARVLSAIERVAA
jgi:hypothetical protein